MFEPPPPSESRRPWSAGSVPNRNLRLPASGQAPPDDPAFARRLPRWFLKLDTDSGGQCAAETANRSSTRAFIAGAATMTSGPRKPHAKARSRIHRGLDEVGLGVQARSYQRARLDARADRLVPHRKLRCLRRRSRRATLGMQRAVSRQRARNGPKVARSCDEVR